MTVKINPPEGFTFVEGRSPEQARALLAAAEGTEHEGQVYTTSFGYLVPDDVAKAAESAESTEETDPEDEGGDPEGDGAKEFDPTDATVAEVNEYLAGADDAERERVLEAERNGKNRSTIEGIK